MNPTGLSIFSITESNLEDSVNDCDKDTPTFNTLWY